MSCVKKCQGITAKGQQCKRCVKKGNTLCWSHQGTKKTNKSKSNKDKKIKTTKKTTKKKASIKKPNLHLELLQVELEKLMDDLKNIFPRITDELDQWKITEKKIKSDKLKKKDIQLFVNETADYVQEVENQNLEAFLEKYFRLKEFWYSS